MDHQKWRESNQRDEQGMTPILFAARSDAKPSIWKLLVAAGPIQKWRTAAVAPSSSFLPEGFRRHHRQKADLFHYLRSLGIPNTGTKGYVMNIEATARAGDREKPSRGWPAG